MNSSESESENAALPPRRAERLLCDLWPDAITDNSPSRVLTTTLGRAQGAEFIARRHPHAAVVCSLLDRYAADVVEGSPFERPANLDLRCEPDFSSDAGLDAVAMPTSSQGEAELTREQLQAAYVSLRPGGLLLTTTDNSRDSWLGEVVESFGGEVRRVPADDGVGYIVRRAAESPPKRVRDFRAEFAFRDGERLINVESRPGVFSHRKIDSGARRLIDSLDVHDGDKVLDVGCGWGAVGLAAACRANVTVVVLDSNTRAVACTNRNAELNGVAARLIAKVEAHGRTDAPGSFDWALANPPYYAQFEIAERFVVACQTALRRGGELRIVTKRPEWYLDRLPGPFGDVADEEIKGYAIIRARKR